MPEKVRAHKATYLKTGSPGQIDLYTAENKATERLVRAAFFHSSPHTRASWLAVGCDAPWVPLAPQQPDALLQAHKLLGDIQVQRQQRVLANKAADAPAHVLEAACQAHFCRCRPPWPCSPGLSQDNHYDLV